VNEARQVPPTPSQIVKKRRAPGLPPSVDYNTKRMKTSEPEGLVPNWKKNTNLLSQIACRNPIEFIDDEDDFIKGEFDRAEGSDMLSAVCALKPPTVRVDTKLVRDYHI
jgi:hypothetical protein